MLAGRPCCACIGALHATARQVRPSLAHSSSNASSAASLKPWRLRKLYRQRCWLTGDAEALEATDAVRLPRGQLGQRQLVVGRRLAEAAVQAVADAQQHPAERRRGGGLALLAWPRVSSNAPLSARIDDARRRSRRVMRASGVVSSTSMRDRVGR